MNGCFQANILAVSGSLLRFIFNLAYISGPELMVWVLSLSDMDLSTHALTPGVPVIVFGVCQVLIGVETLATYQWLYLYYILARGCT